MTDKFKIYPSSAAFMVGPLVAAKSHKSCLRFIWAARHCGATKEDLHQAIAPEYAALGALDEFRYQTTLDKEKSIHEREKPFKIDFGDSTISGRMDFLLEDGTVIEKKSTTSTNVYKRVFEGNEPEPAWVAQVVSYLSLLKLPAGKIVATYYELSEDLRSYSAIEDKEFAVQAIDGDIFIDGRKYPHNVRDLARFYASVDKIASSPCAVPPKPCQPSNPYESPCQYCPLKPLCSDNADLAQSLHVAKQLISEKRPPRPFSINHNTARRNKNREEKKLARSKTT